MRRLTGARAAFILRIAAVASRLRSLAALVAVLSLAACVSPPSMPPRGEPIAVAPGVYALIGSTDEATVANGGRVGNSGFIVGDTGTVVINTGGSYLQGRELIATAERVGGKPVVLALITQPLQEFVMGSAAFVERGIPLMAEHAGAALIGQRCERCLSNLKRLLGDDAMAGTRVIVPERTLDGDWTFEVAGLRLRLIDGRWAQTPGDLAVLDERSGVLFAGGLVSIGRVPELRDADTAGWLAALEVLQRLPVKRLVPGYGAVGTLADVSSVVGYITSLERRVDDLLAAGRSLSESVTEAGLPAYSGWALYGVAHPRNVQQTYLRLEAKAFGRP